MLSYTDFMTLWVTINPETSRVTPRTISEIKRVLEEIQWHARTFWNIDRDGNGDIELVKLDVANDLKGSFLG